MHVLDALLADEPVDVGGLDEAFDAAGLVLGRWERVAVSTQAIAADIERSSQERRGENADDT
jgi:hypothetical protein